MRDIIRGIFWAIYRNLFPWKQTRAFTKYLQINSHKRPSKYIGVEIGVLRGYNAKNLLKNLEIKKLYLIDPYVEYYEYENQKHRFEPLTYKKEKKYAHNLLKPYADKIIWIEKLSEKSLNDIPIHPALDFVYIDGNHTYEFVKKDLELFFPRLTFNGVIGGHDYCSSFPGVVRAVNEFAKKHNLIISGRGIDWWMIKK